MAPESLNKPSCGPLSPRDLAFPGRLYQRPIDPGNRLPKVVQTGHGSIAAAGQNLPSDGLLGYRREDHAAAVIQAAARSSKQQQQQSALRR